MSFLDAPIPTALAPARPEAPDDAVCVAALASARAELLAIPVDRVRAPHGDDHQLGRRVLAGRSPADPPDRLLQLARAMVRAQHQFVWARRPKFVERYDELARVARPAFREVEAAVRLLLRRGHLTRGDLPAPRLGRTFDDRCWRVIGLVDALIEHDLDQRERGELWLVPMKRMLRARGLAARLAGGTPPQPDYVCARELRDRAYTALSEALRQA